MRTLRLIGLVVAASLPAQNAFESVAKTPPSYRHHLTYDPVLDRIVLFGGDRYEDTYLSAPTDETWVWDGAWTEVSSSRRPPPGTGGGIAFDPVAGTAVLVLDGRTWTWDRVDWTERLPAHTPAAGPDPALAYDATRRCVVMLVWSPVPTTWEWDGTDWNERHPLDSPPPEPAVMTYDSTRGVCVAVSETGETWLWDGLEWVPAGQVLPGRADRQTIAFDAARQRVVLVRYLPAAPSPGVWEWNGSTWTDVTPFWPQPGYAAQLVYDERLAQCVLFGGRVRPANPLSPPKLGLDLYAWNGFSWSLHTPRQFPDPTWLHAMAYDAARAEVVVFGGRERSTFEVLNETWAFDGTRWRWRDPRTTPSPRFRAAMAYDATRGRILMFGGDNGVTAFDETWTWDGTDWTRLATPTAPPPRAGAAMAYDPVRGETVLFGGSGLADTWVFDGTTWTQRITATAPAASVGDNLTMAFDTARSRVVLVVADVYWDWDGVDWSYVGDGALISGQFHVCHDSARGVSYVWSDPDLHAYTGVETARLQTVPTSYPPPSRFHFATAYHAAADRIVLFGAAVSGSAIPATRTYNETWTYAPGEPALFARFGVGCEGARGTPLLTAAHGSVPVVGSRFTLELSQLPISRLCVPFVVLGFERPPPIDLTPFGMTRCWLLTSHDVDWPLANHVGVATWDLEIPNDPTLPGLRFYNQAFVLDAHANPLGVIASNAGEARVGLIPPR